MHNLAPSRNDDVGNKVESRVKSSKAKAKKEKDQTKNKMKREKRHTSWWIEQLPIIFLRQPVSVLESLVFSLP